MRPVPGKPAEQRMSAGTGVRHSEFNHSPDEPVHFLQIWLFPDRNGLAPSYEEKHFDVADKRGRLRLVASPDGREGSVLVHQDASIYASILDGADRAEHDPVGRFFTPRRIPWVRSGVVSPWRPFASTCMARAVGYTLLHTRACSTTPRPR